MNRTLHKRMPILFLMTTLPLAGCTPSQSQIQKVLEEHPEIILSAIEKNPERFSAALAKASQTARQQQQQLAARQEQERIDRELSQPLEPSVSKERAILGNPSAPITVVEYSDFQCPFCARAHETMNTLLKNHGQKIRYVYKHLPLPFHPMAMPAAKRFEAIALQSKSKAYEFHDEIFENQQRLSEGEKFLDSAAKKVGADLSRMKKDMESPEVNRRIEEDMAEARKFGISGTPGFIIGGISIRGAQPYANFESVLQKAEQRVIAGEKK
ncbi:MAG: thioredoxin domain-containing protein [Deltaproteobacteria bacterium]|nr:thioredoxin domain-containing protein [Deltaproteobacteria bacterium]